ncbi:lrrc6 [Symbiodinium pilosum]|uniref:Lrrc6 protein n=1 Tax=Symbiodinium pilosum TaxID=2952 RepID=A0A812WY54_SYMPI|nr:lrrc6 [Symbiodinium pilosum]
MPRLTEELIRKRAEHNEGVLSDLEEIALHQQEIEGIESLEACCRHLKILLLQNNIIPKMEGLNKLKELEYLNLALNNISKIEGVDGCESLKKLDLTVNFVTAEDLEESIYNLKANMMLEDLYLTGNPCADWSGCRAYVVAHLPQLKQLDAKLIVPRERIKARQQLPRLQQELEGLAEEARHKRLRELGQPVDEGAYTKESRNEMYLELAEQKAEKERNERRRMGAEPKEPRVVPGVYNARGEIRQCNEGKYNFDLDDWTHPDKIVFELGVPKYLDTSALDVDVNPSYVRVVVKDKVTQLKFSAEVRPDACKVQRSRTTGVLRIDMPLLQPHQAKDPKAPAQPELEPLKPATEPTPARGGRGGYLAGDSESQKSKTVSIQGIYQDPRRVAPKKQQDSLMREVKTTRAPHVASTTEDDDDDDVPPLEVRG